MSGVRNLRAMFESQSKDLSTSPPQDRGRSPGSTGGGSSGTSPRPLSKIRTSFVTVEKSGQMGLQLRREGSGEPSISKRRTSFSINEEKPTTEKRPELNSRISSSAILDPTPGGATETPKMEVGKRLGEQKKEVTKPESLQTETKKAASLSSGHANGNPSSTKTAEKATASKLTSRPAPISTLKAVVQPKVSPSKSANTPRTPTTPRGRGRPEEKKTADQKPENKATRVSLAPNQSSRSTSDATTSKTRIGASPPQTGFVKPKPRSPTRPVKLPASLTAHTASSGSKTSTGATPPRQSLSRASGNAQAINNLQAHIATARSPSRVSTTSTKASTLARKPSTLKTSSRPSLGPPPAQLNKKPSRQSLPRESTPADEGFLARMMRPTTSSASKTLTSPVTDPQRAQSVKRPTTRDGPAKAHEAPKASPIVPKVVKAAISKPAAKETKPAPVKAKVEAPTETPKVAKPSPAPKAESPVAAETATPVMASEPAEEEKQDLAADMASDEVISTEFEEPKLKEEVSSPVESREKPTDEEKTVLKGAPKEPSPVVEEPKPVPELESAKEVPATSIVPPTPVQATHLETLKEVEAPKEPEVVKEVPEAVEVPAAPVPAKEPEPAVVKEEVAPAREPEIVKTEVVKPEIIEDPEDVKAREEIARLNAELMKSAGEQDVGETY